VLLSRARQPGWKYVPLILQYIHPSAEPIYLQSLEELSDPEFAHLEHGSRATYKHGCTGPLCKKAMRDYGRNYQRARSSATKQRVTYKQRFDELLIQLTLAHLTQRESARRAEQAAQVAIDRLAALRKPLQEVR
jgi:hypothetical protein